MEEIKIWKLNSDDYLQNEYLVQCRSSVFAARSVIHKSQQQDSSRLTFDNPAGSKVLSRKTELYASQLMNRLITDMPFKEIFLAISHCDRAVA